ncbi:preprotein translocase subunit SecA [Candidatus Endowatersipora endosymbiont of Watersipora subatra]|uniref:preprotein translocase subunit SecA n=1 Tax=Candidatus Endowatersipora endosymbiont of Watersipora subatra TaxID=3077946 RepID=UPI00312CA359
MALLRRITSRFFRSRNDRKIKKYQPYLHSINALEAEIEIISDDELKAKTDQFRTDIKLGKSVDDLLIPAFAVVREASKRALGMRHFDVQLIGGMILHEGNISEMRTGEGKTLVATLPVYLNALSGKGVHVVTVNDYLAKRDSEWMKKVYSFLGMTTGVIINELDDDERKKAYNCDITYGTNNEFGFDYLRDNMKFDIESMVQRGHHYAIIDEVDSILIDEARTPLIISGPVDDKSDLYTTIDQFIPRLDCEDYIIDEKERSVIFTEDGSEKIEKMLGDAGLLNENSLYDIDNIAIVHHVNNALKAHTIFARDKDYIVRNNEVVIIDEFTGRMTPGRRYSDGQHQALEAKEKVNIQPENKTLASVTFQNYFRMYNKLAGMTGTAMTESDEFFDIYKLNVVEVPTNKPVARIDNDDQIYITSKEKHRAIIKIVKQCQERGQPVLVGTTSIEKSERLSDLMETAGVKNLKVLNALYHEQEAYIIGQAGIPGAVTIATNMAGRGTDIQLGGNLDMRIERELESQSKKGDEKFRRKITEEVSSLKEKAISAGGLFVLATERHESRRIDNQLRGRSGRQGDPGNSIFFLSLEDDLMRIFGSHRMDSMLIKLGLKEDEAITHPWISKALEKAQQKVETHNLDTRKNLLKFDDVMNEQRKVIFEQRIDIMSSDNLSEYIKDMREDTIEELINSAVPEKSYSDQWSIEKLKDSVQHYLNLDLPIKDWANEDGIDEQRILERIINAANEINKKRYQMVGKEILAHIEKSVLLQTLDDLWREHLENLEHLRFVIGLRGYGQRDPLNEYKSEAFQLFNSLLSDLRRIVTSKMMNLEMFQKTTIKDVYRKAIITNKKRQETEKYKMNDSKDWHSVGRNQPCPCGTGLKYKHCHGKIK